MSTKIASLNISRVSSEDQIDIYVGNIIFNGRIISLTNTLTRISSKILNEHFGTTMFKKGDSSQYFTIKNSLISLALNSVESIEGVEILFDSSSYATPANVLWCKDEKLLSELSALKNVYDAYMFSSTGVAKKLIDSVVEMWCYSLSAYVKA